MVPYHPMLVVDPLSLLNYNHTVAGVRSITCAPTGLESTSLVLVNGLDTFFAHAAPSKRFDSLSADFNKPILVVSLVSLVVATLAAKWKLQAASLKAAWE
jgi:ER membrane protein complex subunit 1